MPKSAAPTTNWRWRGQAPPSRTAGSDVTNMDEPPGHRALIEVHVTDLKQLFHSLDPTPFRERDLDPKAEQFIAGWASELPAEAPLCLVVHVDGQAPPAAEVEVLREAVREFFSQRAVVTRRRLRQLFQVGRTSLLIGTAALAASIVIGDIAANLMDGLRFGGIVMLSPRWASARIARSS